MTTAQLSDRPASAKARRRAPVRWPWVVAALAWGVALLATLLRLRFLIDHHWLIEASGLPWLLAALVFLACWQVMTLAMMLPSSMRMMQMIRCCQVHYINIGIRQHFIKRAVGPWDAEFGCFLLSFFLIGFC